MAETSIEWTDHTVNPFRARATSTNRVGHFCEKISPGCAHCYASTWNEERFGTHLPFLPVWRDSVRLFLDESKLDEVRRRRKPTTYFWCDMTDMFFRDHPDEWIDRCFATMAATPHHTHQVLTKRADRLAAYFADRLTEARVWGLAAGQQTLSGEPWPLPNVWVGVSVEDQQRADERIPHLLGVPAAVRFLSVEPLLSELVLHKYLAACGCGHGHGFTACPRTGGVARICHRQRCSCVGLSPLISWVIAGGESGPDARPFLLDWAASLRDQCAAAGVPYFLKQLGSTPRRLTGLGVAEVLVLRNRKGGDMAEWPEDLRVRQFPGVAGA